MGPRTLLHQRLCLEARVLPQQLATRRGISNSPVLSNRLSIVSGPPEPALLHQTTGQHLTAIASQYGDSWAIISRHQQARLSYSGLDANSSSLAQALQRRLGVRKGDRVAVSLGNGIEFSVVTYAVFKLGAILVPLNPAFTAEQMKSALDHLEASHLIISLETNFPRKQPRSNVPLLSALYPSLGVNTSRSEVIPSLRTVTIVDNTNGRIDPLSFPGFHKFPDLLEDGLAIREPINVELHPDEVCNIQFTSGTTALPKAAMLSHKSILNNGKSIGDRLALTNNDIVCCPPPLFHCFGSVLGYMACATHASAIVFPSECFDPLASLLSVQEEGCTALYGVPTMFMQELELLEKGMVKRVGFGTLRTGIGAGSSVPAALMEKLHNVFNLTELTICYGQTETSPVSLMTTRSCPLTKRISTVGIPLPHVSCKIVNPTNHHEIRPIGVRGELCVSGYHLQKGYYNDPINTAAVMLRDSTDPEKIWLHSGDEAVMDEDGYIAITGRLKDLIIRGGENIHPLEIENCLLQHESVKEVSVVAVNDHRYGEVVAAFVRLDDVASLEAEELRQWVRQRLSGHLVPKYVFWTDDFPKTPSGKIQKYLLSERAETLKKNLDTKDPSTKVN